MERETTPGNFIRRSNQLVIHSNEPRLMVGCTSLNPGVGFRQLQLFVPDREQVSGFGPTAMRSQLGSFIIDRQIMALVKLIVHTGPALHVPGSVPRQWM